MSTVLEPGIRRLANGRYVAYVRVKGHPLRYKRFPAETTLSAVRRWRREMRWALEHATEDAQPLPDTLGALIPGYLDALTDRPRLRDERALHLAWWSRQFPDTPAAAIQPLQIRSALAALRTDQCVCGHSRARHGPDRCTGQRVTTTRGGIRERPCGCRSFRPLSAATANKYRFSLYALYRALGLANPVASVPVFQTPKLEPRAISYDLVRLIIDAMSDLGGAVPGQRDARLTGSKAKARIRVLAWTGMRHSELKRFRPADWNRVTHTLLVRTGKGGEVATLPLCAEAEAALEELIRVNAIGSFSNSTLHRAFRLALAKVNADLPPGSRLEVRPYDLRHTFGTWMYQATGDLRIVKELMRHRHQRTTERYTLGYVPAYMWRATERFAALTAAGGDAPPLPDVDRHHLRLITSQ